MSDAGKIKRTMGWQYRIADLRDDLAEISKERGDRLIHAQVTSGDSGKKYWVQLNFPKEGKVMSICECPDGYFNWYYGAHALDVCCKHAKNLVMFLKEKGKI